MTVRIERTGAVAVVVLDDPDRRNAMSAETVAGIVAAFDELEADGTGAVVVTGAPPAFCSGAVLGDLGALSSGEDAHAIRDVYEGFLRVLRSPLPTLAAVNGPAVGAGMNLALACDVRLAGASARFDTRFLRIGLHPGGGHTWMLDRAVGPQAAAAMVLFGEVLDGPGAARVGLAWACVPDDELRSAALALAERAASAPRELVVRTKATLRGAPGQPSFEAALAHEVAEQVWSLGQGWFPAAGGLSGRGSDPPGPPGAAPTPRR